MTEQDYERMAREIVSRVYRYVDADGVLEDYLRDKLIVSIAKNITQAVQQERKRLLEALPEETGFENEYDTHIVWIHGFNSCLEQVRKVVG